MATEIAAPVAPPADPPAVEGTPAPEAGPQTLKERLEAAKAKAVDAPAPAAEPEKPPEPEKAPPPAPAEKQGAALAKLAREQKAAREAQEALKAQKAAWEQEQAAKLKEFEKELAELNEFKALRGDATRFPLKVLQKLGLDPKLVNEAILNDGEPTANLEVQAVREELTKLRQEQEAREKRQAEEREREAAERRKQAEAQEAEALKAFQAECASFVDKNAEKYELTAQLEQQHLVFQTISEVYRQTAAEGKPRLLSVEEAAEEVEKALEAQLEKATKTKKFTAKQPSTQQTAAPSPKKTSTKPPEQAPAKTLSNTGTAPVTSNGAQTESYAARRARVLAKFS